MRPKQSFSSHLNPLPKSSIGRYTKGDSSFLVALTQNCDGTPFTIHVINVKPGKFTYTDTGGVKQLYHGQVAKGHRFV